MGEITYIANGIATTIHDDGTKTSSPMDQCDQCFSWEPKQGGLLIRLTGGEPAIWVCAKCRA